MVDQESIDHEYVKQNSEASDQSWTQLDKYIFGIASTAVALSMTFWDKVYSPESGTVVFLQAGWICFCISIFLTLTSFITAAHAATKNIENTNLGINDSHNNLFSTITLWLNYISALSCLSGIILLLIFAIQNIEKNSDIHVPQTCLISSNSDSCILSSAYTSRLAENSSYTIVTPPPESFSWKDFFICIPGIVAIIVSMITYFQNKRFLRFSWWYQEKAKAILKLYGHMEVLSSDLKVLTFDLQIQQMEKQIQKNVYEHIFIANQYWIRNKIFFREWNVQIELFFDKVKEATFFSQKAKETGYFKYYKKATMLCNDAEDILNKFDMAFYHILHNQK